MSPRKEQEIPSDNSVRAIFVKRWVKCDVQKKNKKWLAEENLSKNSTKTVGLFALDFYELIGLISYHLREISSS